MRNHAKVSFGTACAGLFLYVNTLTGQPVPPPPRPALSTTTPASAPSTAPALLPDWKGQIKIGDKSIRFGIHFTGGILGWTGTFDQPDQGLFGLSLKGIKKEGDGIRFAIAGVPGNPSFDGVIVADRITGTFTQGAINATFELEPGNFAAARRPQDPVKPYPYQEVEVMIDVKKGVTLAGTLTIPAGEKPARGWPVAVMITGSGPQDRDENLLGHRFFLVIADHLTRAGIAVLRCDDRGTAKSTGDFASATTADFADDALANVAFVRARPEINPAAVGVIGHSEGGLIGPMVAARDPKVAFVVMLAGPGVNGQEILGKQLGEIALSSGVPKDVVARSVAIQHRMLQAIVKGDDKLAHTEMVNLILDQQVATEAMLSATKPATGTTTSTTTSPATAPTTRPVGAAQRLLAEAAAVGELAKLTSPWMRYFMTLDPQVALRQVKVPVLALNGTLDRQVDLEQNLARVGDGLKQAGNNDVTLKTMPGLNHLFQHAKTGSPLEYGPSEETCSPEVLAIVTEWINARFGAKK